MRIAVTDAARRPTREANRQRVGFVRRPARIEYDFQAAGLVEARPGDNRRRPYRLTALGLNTVRDEIQRLTAFTGEAPRRLRLTVAR